MKASGLGSLFLSAVLFLEGGCASFGEKEEKDPYANNPCVKAQRAGIDPAAADPKNCEIPVTIAAMVKATAGAVPETRDVILYFAQQYLAEKDPAKKGIYADYLKYKGIDVKKLNDLALKIAAPDKTGLNKCLSYKGNVDADGKVSLVFDCEKPPAVQAAPAIAAP